MIIGKPMCWVKDEYNNVTEDWSAHYHCKAMDYYIVKSKELRAPDCFGLCEHCKERKGV